MKEITIVRENLMTERGYTPYCGNTNCHFRNPRTKFTGEQFECKCGWFSTFPARFIKRYKEKWNL